MTPTSEELQRLLERVEGTSGPDRELECRVWCAIEGHAFSMLLAPGRSNSSWSFSYVVKGDQLPTWRDPTIYVPRYTESFDAALALSPAFTFGSFEPLLGRIILDWHAPDWVIVGGESGPNFRAINGDDVRYLRDQSRDLERTFFFKQWGGRTPKANGKSLDGVTHCYRPAA